VSHYVHHIPGRLRVRSAAIKRNEIRAEALKRLLEGTAGVTSAEVNTLTGSVMIRYNSEITSGQALVDMLRDRGYLTSSVLTGAPERAFTLPAFGGEIGGMVAKKVAAYAIETAVERSVVALVAALL
jgi:copper chaperone CopZ